MPLPPPPPRLMCLFYCVRFDVLRFVCWRAEPGLERLCCGCPFGHVQQLGIEKR